MMKVLIIKHIGIEGPGLIEFYFRKENITYQIINLEKGDPFPKLDHLSLIILLGGPMNVYEEDRYPFLKEEDLFIKEAIERRKSILGICLGAQLIAKALGAKVFKAPIKEIGWYDVSLTRIGLRDSLFSNIPKIFSVFQWHEDTFDIPKGAKLIATSSAVPHQAFRYGNNAYGLQFHLEVTKEMIQEWMKTYEEELQGSPNALFLKLKILTDTETEIETYTQRGMKFLERLIKQARTIHQTL